MSPVAGSFSGWMSSLCAAVPRAARGCAASAPGWRAWRAVHCTTVALASALSCAAAQAARVVPAPAAASAGPLQTAMPSTAPSLAWHGGTGPEPSFASLAWSDGAAAAAPAPLHAAPARLAETGADPRGGAAPEAASGAGALVLALLAALLGIGVTALSRRSE